MKPIRKDGWPHQPVADVWKRTLSQIPTVFGRLVYLAGLRDPNTGRYEHFGLAQMFGDDEAHQALCESHLVAFSQWLSFTLEQQKQDLDRYLESLHRDPRTVLETWSRVQPYRNLIPASAPETERRLYLADLETLLEVLRSEYGVVGPDPDA
ncbi:MAG: hypothetical protein RMI94_03855 [Bryobacterales bacterium]|nr:hypothetical protein [Bryobacteraceae bacterium]MDW8129658.1 hypothetical protein [Bryobacterales bacterium]